MKTCRYCLGSIPEAARKCQHCGEWLEPAGGQHAAGERAGTSGGSLRRFFGSNRLDETLNEGVKWYTKYWIVMTILGLIFFLFFFFTVFLPQWERMGANDGPSFSPGVTEGTSPSR